MYRCFNNEYEKYHMKRTLVVVRHVVQSLFTKSCIIFRFANKFDTIPYGFFFVEYIPNTILNRLPLYCIELSIVVKLGFE